MPSRLALWLSLLVFACGGSRPPPPTQTAEEPSDPEPEPTSAPIAPEARVRLIHAAVESRQQALTLNAEGASSEPAGFEFASTSLSLEPGQHAISAQAEGTELIGASFTLPDGSSTLIAYSTGDFPVALALAADPIEAAPADTAHVRIFHAIVGQTAVDVCAPPTTARGDGTPILPNVAPGSFGAPDAAYIEVAAGQELLLQIRSQNATPCHGRVVGTVHGFTPVSESNYTLVLVGRTGRRGMPPELLFCADPPAIDPSCAVLGLDPH